MKPQKAHPVICDSPPRAGRVPRQVVPREVSGKGQDVLIPLTALCVRIEARKEGRNAQHDDPWDLVDLTVSEICKYWPVI
jgi:hypothetical protein